VKRCSECTGGDTSGTDVQVPSTRSQFGDGTTERFGRLPVPPVDRSLKLGMKTAGLWHRSHKPRQTAD
jgi:hypothetical protein